jgi:hypothetical protein
MWRGRHGAGKPGGETNALDVTVLLLQVRQCAACMDGAWSGRYLSRPEPPSLPGRIRLSQAHESFVTPINAGNNAGPVQHPSPVRRHPATSCGRRQAR